MNLQTLLNPEVLADIVPTGPPVYDLQRTYLWSGTFFKTNWDFGTLNMSSLGSIFADPFSASKAWSAYKYIKPQIMIPNMEYISSLIKVVDQPQQNILTEERKIGPLSVQVPTSVSLEPFEVQFVEETLGSVEYFYRNFFLEMTGGGTLTFAALRKLAVSFLFTRNASSLGNALPKSNNSVVNALSGSLLGNLPNNAYLYPHVLPVEYKVDPWDKSADGYQISTIKFIRIPNMGSLQDGSVTMRTLANLVGLG